MLELVALVALILAVYAAVLSTGLVIWAVRVGNRTRFKHNNFDRTVPTMGMVTGEPAIVLVEDEIDFLIVMERFLHGFRGCIN